MSGFEIEPCFAPAAAIENAINKYYGDPYANYARKVMEEAAKTEPVLEDATVAKWEEDLKRGDDARPIVRLCYVILAEALRQGAREIDIEPYARSSRIRFCIDGEWAAFLSPPPKRREALTKLFKVMAKADPSECRPQSGQICIRRLTQDGRQSTHYFELSTSSTSRGERLSFRIEDSVPNELPSSDSKKNRV